MDGLNKILDKLGIYDLTAVLLPGIITWSFTIISLRYCFSVDLQKSIVVDNVVFFLAISYSMGLVLQEVGSDIQKFLDYKSNTLLMRALKTDKKSHRRLTEVEKSGIAKSLIEHGVLSKEEVKECSECEAIDHHPSKCFEYCRNVLFVTHNYLGLDKDRTLAAFSRSLAIFCICMLLAIMFWSILDSTIKIPIVCVLIVLFIIFSWRCYRLSVSWHMNILKRYYYIEQCNKINDQKNQQDVKRIFSENAHDSMF